MATQFSICARKIPWPEELGRLQSTGSSLIRGLSLFAGSGGDSPVALGRLFIVMAPLIVEHGPEGSWASGLCDKGAQ